ncbi:MAG: cyclic pyranopterin monophosphate synthase MoaC, partial [Candidatus Krumholzibacteria bacterium]|nr:cyclic pyranopterin monophosphate synthase MoaC [Candidatus Krumholzibacteria bacterium]
MKSVTAKTNTLRRAVATASLRAAQATIERLQSNDLPKKDVLPVARVAGVCAAKRTTDLIPYCHPVPIDSVEISFEVGDDRIDISAAVEAVWKTGVEMEALAAATVAALTIYDMLKPVDTHILIENVKLESKRGGKREFSRRARKGLKAAVIVTSDSTYEGTREDRSGRLVCQRLE